MRRWMLWFGVMAAAVLVVALGYGCGETTSGTCADNGTCTDDGGATLDGTAPDVGVAPDSPITSGDDGGTTQVDSGSSSGGGNDAGGCDTTGEPRVETCLVDSTYGVFVSPNGGDTAAGTMNAPLKTITAGIAKAALGPKRVFVCAGTYDEHLVVGTSPDGGTSEDGVGVYGGFDCTGWKYQASNAVKVAPSTTGYALEVDTLTVGATFEDLEFDAQSAQLPGASSIAVFANQSVVTFKRVVMKAGDGATGAPGDAGSNYVTPQAALGNDADGGTGGAQQTCTCLNGDMSVGGAGGNAGPPSVSGLAGMPALGGGQPGNSGAGTCAAPGGGAAGTGSSDAPVASGAMKYGTLTAQGWSVADGAAGVAASVAQGGGGGGGTSGTPGHGGGSSGGCGGCGGGGGAAGLGGGASFALLSFQSTISLSNGALSSGNGQSGGSGGPGQVGQTGGIGGSSSNPGCQGAPGGTGGAGGGGGGGAGGVSAAIGYVGTAPTQTATTTTVGNFGTGGPGGMGGGASNSGGKGKDGVAMATLAL